MKDVIHVFKDYKIIIGGFMYFGMFPRSCQNVPSVLAWTVTTLDYVQDESPKLMSKCRLDCPGLRLRLLLPNHHKGVSL